jgi:NitT/TauT family transport system substrate-binding protein
MTTVMSRRDVLAGSAALMLAAGSPALAQSGPPDVVRVGKAVYSAFAFAFVDVGNDAGIWKALNLSLDITAFRGDSQVQEALAGGSLDVGLGSGPSMVYRTKGVPAIAVAIMAGRPLDMALVVANNSPIKKLSELKGKRIGVTTSGSLTDWLARQVSAGQGWGPEGVTILPLGAMETRVNALGTGQIQASVHDLTEAYELERIGKGTILTLFGDIVKDFDTHVIFATDVMVNQKSAVLARFLKGWFQSVAYTKKNKAAAITTIAKVMHVDESVVYKSYPAMMQMMSTDGVFTQSALDVVRKSVGDLAMYDQPLEFKNMYTSKFVPVKV